MRARNLAPATVRTCSTGARQHLDWLAANAPEVSTPEQVRRADCETFLAELMARSTASTAKTRHTGMSRSFAFLLEEEELTRPQMQEVRPHAVPDVRVPVLSDEELRRLFKTCDGKTYADRRDTAITRLFYDTGIRRSAWLRSPRRATRTTSRSNSGGKYFGTATSSLRDLVPQKRWQPELQQSRRQASSVAEAYARLRL